MTRAFLIMVTLISVSATRLPAADPASRTLSNGILEVDVMDPNHPELYYRGVRFSPVANVLQVRKGGRSFLYAPAEHDPMTQAAGLPMEFDIQPPIAPPGFPEAAEGEGFVKVGVGVLAKEDVIYRFFTPYRVIRLAETSVEWHADRAVFVQICRSASGYAYRLEAEVTLRESELQVSYQLVNTGEKAFDTEQYAHDFFRLGDAPVGPGYVVKCSFSFEVRIPKPVIEASGESIRIIGEISDKMKAADAFLTPREGEPLFGPIQVSNPASGMSVTAGVSVPLSRINIHVSNRYICPEQFVRMHLEPGASHAWVRNYHFDIEDRK